MGAFREVMNANRSGSGSLTNAALRMQQALEYKQARGAGARSGSDAITGATPAAVTSPEASAAAPTLDQSAAAAAVAAKARALQNGAEQAEEVDLGAKLPPNAPARVRSAVAAAMQYRQAKAAKVAAAAGAAAAAAALPPKPAAAKRQAAEVAPGHSGLPDLGAAASGSCA
jgi:hypothetical protein